MNQPPIAILLYSKYSQRCKEFLDLVDDRMGIRTLCIDNKEVREKIVEDTNGYHVRTVPCVFLLFSNGRLEKYEGSDAFVWLRKIVETLTPHETPLPVEPAPQIHPEQPKRQEPVESLPEEMKEQQEDETEDPQKRTERLIEKEMSMRQSADQLITRKTLNIKEMAQMMQQQRDMDEERMNPPPPGSLRAS